MAFDIVAFSQSELDSAVNNGIRAIALCDGDFVIPLIPNVCYASIGGVNAVIYADEDETRSLGIIFDGFLPIFLSGGTVNHKRASSLISSGSAASSFSSSYFLSSFTLYAYAYASSFGASGVTSFTSSYVTSYAASFVSSYMTSYAASFVSSFTLSLPPASAEDRGTVKCVQVNGYGVNLI